MSSVTSFYLTEVNKWRKGAAVAWIVLLSPIVLFTFLLFGSMNPFHPIQWVSDSAFLILTPGNWSYDFILAVVMGVLALFTSRQYSVIPDVMCSRWAYVKKILHPKNVINIWGHSAVGLILVWCYVHLIGGRFRDFSKPCSQKQGNCVNEYQLFALLHGVFVGFTYSFKCSLDNTFYLTFPVVQQPKYFQVQIRNLLQGSGTQVLKQIKYFYLLYYLFLGSFFKNSLLHHSYLYMKVDDLEAVDSFPNILSLSLFFQTILSGTFVLLLFKLTDLILKIYQTEPFQFLIHSVNYQENKGNDLMSALGSKNPLVQYIAYLDLYQLSQKSPERRQVIYSLSQPGGHPHNWNSVSTECLSALESFTSQIMDFNNKTIANGPARQERPQFVGARDVTTLTPISSSIYVNNSLKQLDKLNKDVKEYSKEKKREEEKKQKQTFAWLFAEQPDAMSRKLFSNAQIYIWAAEALSYLAEASYLEDSFGVVQKALPDVIGSILLLQEVVEKHFKLGFGASKKSYKEEFSLRMSLKTALKTSLYRIVTKFHKHMHSIDLSVEHKRRLQQFMDFKE